MSILPKEIYRFNTIPIKILSKIYMEPQKAPHSNNDLDKEQSWKNHVSNIKLYCKAIVIKTTRYWYINRHIDQWNRI